MSMSLSQARVIDPVLTEVAQGYRHADRVGSTLFPRVEVLQRGGQVIEFGRESFRLYNARRAPGASTLNIGFGYEGKPFSLVQDALNAPIPREHIQDAKTVPDIDLGRRATNTCMMTLTLSLEWEQAQLATNAANYDNDHKVALAGTSQWSSPDSDPLADVDEAKEAVRRTAGVDPNRMVISKPVFNALKVHPKIVDRFRYTTADSITARMLASFFDLDELAVGRAATLAEPRADAPFVDVWGNVAVLAYVAVASQGVEEPSYGYTYTLKGHPFVEQPFWDNDRKSWVYGVTYERVPVLTGISSGFLFQNVVAK